MKYSRSHISALLNALRAKTAPGQFPAYVVEEVGPKAFQVHVERKEGYVGLWGYGDTPAKAIENLERNREGKALSEGPR